MSTDQIAIPQTEPSRAKLSPAFLRRRKAFMIMPAVVVPFLFLFFMSLGGGKGSPGKQQQASTGINVSLPDARFNKRAPEKSKLDLYKQADQDSLRRKEYFRQDPYFQRKIDTFRHHPLLPEEAKTDEVLERLNKLRQTVRQPAPPPAILELPRRQYGLPKQKLDTVEVDPELEKLNGMLDKIIRIQHPKEEAPTVSDVAGVSVSPDTMANSLPAVVQQDQVLVAGGTIALRLTEAVRINGVLFPRDQLAYGVVSIGNDRMLITVNSLRRGQSIFSTALQVYDLDGLAGIHIPGDLGRDVAKESADQGIHSLNPASFDPSLAGQAVNAGVLTARSLLSRKVRQVRVGVRAGYQVLLRSTKAPVKVIVSGPVDRPDSVLKAPDPESFTPFLHKTVRGGRLKLRLEGIYLRDSLLWVMLRLENRGPIGYVPDHQRWYMLDRRGARRTAMQEIAVAPTYTSPVEALASDSSRVLLTAFRPFALPEDKDLVLQMAESNGARELVMAISGKDILKARSYGQP